MKDIKYERLKKSLLMLDIKIIMVSLIFFGQYYKISSSKTTSAFLRIYCICASMYSIYFTIIHFSYINSVKSVIFNSLIITEYQFWFFTSQITSRFYLSTFTRTIFTCDSLMGHRKKVFEIKYVLILIVIAQCLSLASYLSDILFSSFWNQIFHTDKINGIFALINHKYTTHSIDLASYTIVLVVGLLQNRLMLLRQTLERNTVPVNIVSKGRIQPKLRIIRKCVINYKNLLDAFDDANFQMQFTMITSLVFNIPKAVLCGYSFMKEMLIEVQQTRVVILDVFRLTLSIIAPSALSEMCHSEVDKLKATLTMQFIQCSDAEMRVELHRALDYVTQRPFSFTLLRAVCVDSQLPITVFALVVTYVILLIQFTHFSF